MALRTPPLHAAPVHTCLPLEDYDLDATLSSGQAFRWHRRNAAWEGVIGRRWVQLRAQGSQLHAVTAGAPNGWSWLRDYLQTEICLTKVLRTFPKDAPLLAAVSSCRGLRLLHQDPWECLASFLLSATTQIVQIQQVVELLCRRFGPPVAVPEGHPPAYAFPAPATLAEASESDLRACRMGFRAPHLLSAARAVAEARLDLNVLQTLPLEEARSRLESLRGVGPKIADCVLLFSCRQPRAFPIDVWVARALRAGYFRGGRPGMRRLREFAGQHFGPYAGYAQQYLFHSARLRRLVSG